MRPEIRIWKELRESFLPKTYLRHALLEIQGEVEKFYGIPTSPGQEPDIADLFSCLSKRYGLEGQRDVYNGMWETHFLYTDDTLVEGDFLATTLPMEILYDQSTGAPIEDFLTMAQMTLSSICTYRIERLRLLIGTSEEVTRVRKTEPLTPHPDYLEKYLSLREQRVLHFSTLRARFVSSLPPFLSSKERVIPLSDAARSFAEIGEICQAFIRLTPHKTLEEKAVEFIFE